MEEGEGGLAKESGLEMRLTGYQGREKERGKRNRGEEERENERRRDGKEEIGSIWRGG